MSALGLLFRDVLRRDRVRLVCALVGVAAAAALLAWAVGLAETTAAQCRPLAERLGRPFDCWVATGRASAAAPKGSGMQTLAHGSPFKMIPAAVAEAVKASPDVASVLATTVFRCRLDWRPEGRPLQGAGVVAGVAPVRDFPECPYPEGLAAGRWPRADAPEPEFAISPRAFGEEGLRDAPPVGTRIPVVTPAGRMEATLCGYLAEGIRPVGGFPTMFASDGLAAATALAETGGGCNLMLIRLRPFRSPDALAETVRTVSPDDDAATLVTRQGLLRQLRSDATNNLLFQLPLLVALACVATCCMIVSALCVGLEQNRLRHARLRALGMTARQLMDLVAREALFLAGVGGLLGLGLGLGVLALFVRAHPLAFPDGLMVGWVTPVAVAALLGLSAAAALWAPLRRAARLSPCELRAAPEAWRAAHPLRRGLIALAATLPVLGTLIPFTPNPLLRSVWFLLVGLPLALWGLTALTRPLMALCERLLARPLGALLRLRPALLRGVLTRAADRNAHMALTLTAGLGAFFAIHIWGASLTDPFIPSRTLPPAIVSLLPNGVSPACAQTLARETGLPLRPFFAEQYRLDEADFQAIGERAGRLPAQNNILLVATPGERGVTVTEMFARQCRLRVGDTFRIQRLEAGGDVRALPLTITRVVRCNWHLVTARAGMRARDGAPFGTLGPVFVGMDVAAAWDPARAARVRFLWLDALPAASGADALYSAANLLELRLQRLAEADPEPFRAAARGPGPRAAFPNVVVHLRDEIAEGTLAHSGELLGELARIPLWSLLILSLGFVSLLAANVRAMAGELRTLHAVGMTRAQMGRFLFAQALILCAVAALLSLLLGLTVGWGFTGWTLAWMPFGGLPTVLVLPWPRLLEGFGLLLAATLTVTPLPICLLIRALLRR